MAHNKMLIAMAKHFGLRWILFRSKYRLKKQLGYFSYRFPICSWEDLIDLNIFFSSSISAPDKYRKYKLNNVGGFFFKPDQILKLGSQCTEWDGKENIPVKAANRIASGYINYFGSLELQTGYPPKWHYNYFEGLAAPQNIHWSRISDFDHGDIKLIWEPSRFSFSFYLMRAYARTGDEKYGEMFWQAIENWVLCNQPLAGINWMCGQEISIRLIAWCFGMFVFMHSQSSTSTRLIMFARAMYCFGKRIEANLNYALSQNNNHGISEAAGLWTIGVLFPELKAAKKWRKKSKLLLEKQARELIYKDGGFSQLSSNYHRLVLQLYTWVLSLGKLNGREFSPSLQKRLNKALNWSYQLIEKQNGHMPNSGGNDGALLLPLSNCDQNDHRPALQALSYLLNQKLMFPPGPWDEELLWLFGPTALKAPRDGNMQSDYSGPTAAFHVLRNSRSWAVLRCGPYRHRPVHADLLHLDVWWRGQNIARDPGSYSYNAGGAWKKGLAGTEVHNTVVVAGRDQMNNVHRFLWLPWAKSTFLGKKRSPKKLLACMEGIHLGYSRLINGPIHRRIVIGMKKEWWLIIDFLPGRKQLQFMLHWLLNYANYTWEKQNKSLTLDYPVGKYQIIVGTENSESSASVVIADPSSPRGWCSPRYMSREPAISLSLETLSEKAVFWTVMGPAGFKVNRKNGIFAIEGEDFNARVDLKFSNDVDHPSIGLVSLEGEYRDYLKL